MRWNTEFSAVTTVRCVQVELAGWWRSLRSVSRLVRHVAAEESRWRGSSGRSLVCEVLHLPPDQVTQLKVRPGTQHSIMVYITACSSTAGRQCHIEPAIPLQLFKFFVEGMRHHLSSRAKLYLLLFSRRWPPVVLHPRLGLLPRPASLPRVAHRHMQTCLAKALAQLHTPPPVQHRLPSVPMTLSRPFSGW